MPDLKKEWDAAFEHPGEAIPVGRTVVCDICDQDWTDRPESGGFLFVSKAYCPDEAPARMMAPRHAMTPVTPA